LHLSRVRVFACPTMRYHRNRCARCSTAIAPNFAVCSQNSAELTCTFHKRSFPLVCFDKHVTWQDQVSTPSITVAKEMFGTSRNKLATQLPNFYIVRQHSRPRDRGHAVATLTFKQNAQAYCKPHSSTCSTPHKINTQWVMH
jgi:hypothetical protein